MIVKVEGPNGTEVAAICALDGCALMDGRACVRNDTQRRVGPEDRRANDPNAPNMPYRRMSAGRRAGDAERRKKLLLDSGEKT